MWVLQENYSRINGLKILSNSTFRKCCNSFIIISQESQLMSCLVKSFDKLTLYCLCSSYASSASCNKRNKIYSLKTVDSSYPLKHNSQYLTLNILHTSLFIPIFMRESHINYFFLRMCSGFRIAC